MTSAIFPAAQAQVWRNRVVMLVAGLGGLALIAVLLIKTLREQGGTNSFALVAESFLTGTPWVSTCFGADCGHFGGKTYVVFPPFPGVVALPLVLLRGIQTTGFMVLSCLMLAASLGLWNRIFKALKLDGEGRWWMLAALALASPLYYVSLRGDGVWFFAQSVAFCCLSIAIHEVILGRSLFIAGVALGLAFLSRQMSIFYAPLLFVFYLRDEPLLKVTGERLRAVLTVALPLFAALLAYFAYNYWRFGNPLDTGYNYIFTDAKPEGLISERAITYGLWNKAYLVYNVFYTFLQGFHAQFADVAQLKLSGLDSGGTSLLAASPWLLLLFFAPADRRTFAVLAMIAGFTGMLLFYHSNGFSQYNTQRYALDWLPAALLILAPLVTPERLPWLRLLITWGIVLNVAAMAVLVLTKAS